MKNNNLNNTKKKLTIIFTLIVFFVAIFLEFIFFTGKYLNYLSSEMYNFDKLTNFAPKKYLSINHFISRYDIGNKLFRLKQQKLANIDSMEQNYKNDFFNLLVIDRNSLELIFGNIINNVDRELILEELKENDYNKVDINKEFLIKKVLFIDGAKEYEILFIKKLNYCLGDYFRDLLGFVFVSLVFSLLFYYIGYRFVSKNFEPVEQNLEDMQDFIHNAGHELKTPISVINSNLQLLLELKKYDKELVIESIDEIKRLDKLIEGLVSLSDINSISKLELIDLKEEIDLIIKDFSKFSKEKNISIDFEIKNNYKLKASKEYFYIFFSNLFGNAIKYNKNGGYVKVYLNKNTLKIEDSGVGIDENDLNKIWNRFYQVDKSRNSKGFGIGLSLVKKISNIYKWKISVKSKVGVGTTFEINF